MKLVKIKGISGSEFYINPENVSYVNDVDLDNGCCTAIHLVESATIYSVCKVDEVVEKLEGKKSGSFNTDDFFSAAVERAYRKTNTCACCGKEIPEGWQICCDCAGKM